MKHYPVTGRLGNLAELVALSPVRPKFQKGMAGLPLSSAI